ncbi:unnamed protein product [Rhizoctonia solani]|uniref:DUF7918 domain-containing protein n=1 Tax=Rhizoctonia solani TaxID=456999 RepID=A0A8H3GTA7_9AGAM|nr:unnamed protein product [Rhizoctonia solani]
MSKTVREEGELVLGAIIVDSSGQSLHTSRPIEISRADQTIKECWIPSVEGQQFEIQWVAGAPDAYRTLDVRATLYLDGIEMDCGVLMADEWAKYMRGWLDGQQVDIDKACPFQFGKLEVTDDDSNVDLNVCIEDLNTIRVVLEWGRSTQPQKKKGRARRPKFSCPKAKGPIHERHVKKGNFGSAGLGKPTPSDITPEVHPFEPESSIPPATFIFRYASIDWLHAHDILLYDDDNNPVYPSLANNNYKEVIDVDEIESEPELGPGSSDAEDELGVEALILVVPNSSKLKDEEMDLELDQPLGKWLYLSKLCARREIEMTNIDEPKPKLDNQHDVMPSQLEMSEDEDVYIYKIMVPVFNLRSQNGDTKVKVEPDC